MISLPSSGPSPAAASEPAKGRPPRHTKAHPAEAQQAAQNTKRDREWVRAEEEVRAYNECVKAENKARRCDYARQQLEVAQAQRPVYSRDNDGNRKYVEDSDRVGVVASARRRVASECS